MYEVIKAFVDLEENRHLYAVGSTYPAPGMKKPTAKRIKALSSEENAVGVPLIIKVKSDNDTPDEDEQSDKE